jgi:hypothetical protein
MDHVMRGADAASPGASADDAVVAEVQERYARFARDEAPGRSDVYEEWAAGVAADTATARLLTRIPATRRQPPLVFAVTRLLGAPLGGFEEWSRWLAAHIDAAVAESGRRGLQTNEPLRCAALLPALSGIEGPIALLEVGASAGLCLYPDRYSYRYRGGPDLDPADGASAVVLESAMHGGPPLRMPDVVWRAGIDLEPLDAADADDRRFLTSLVWPGEEGRAARIEAAKLAHPLATQRDQERRGGARVEGDLEALPGPGLEIVKVPAGEPRDQRDVGGARNRQKLRRPLHAPQDQRPPPGEAGPCPEPSTDQADGVDSASVPALRRLMIR